MVCCPQDGGPIYTIATADGKKHPKQIHRTEIRPVPCTQTDVIIPDPGLPSDLFDEVDNYVPEIPFVLELVEQVLQNTPRRASLVSPPTREVDMEGYGADTLSIEEAGQSRTAL